MLPVRVLLPGRERENRERLKPRVAEYRCGAQGRAGP